MKWEIIRRGLVVAGALYLVALVPTSVRPSWTAAPFRKPDQTIMVAADNAFGLLPADFPSKMKTACKATWALRPVMGSAKKVTVLVKWKTKILASRDYNCAAYV